MGHRFDIPDGIGRHNAQLEQSRMRLIRGQGYKDCSTVVVIPVVSDPDGRSRLDLKVWMNWRNLMSPMNQKVFWLPITGMEVGAAYSTAVDLILGNPEFKKWPYMLTLETDNLPPPDGLIKLIEAIETDKHLGAVGGLYWTKGEAGQPMIYGHPQDIPLNFRPQIPQPDTLQYCNGLGMGFTLFRTKMFAHPELMKPIFRTVQEVIPGVGARAYTQDLFAFEQFGRLGYRFACDTRVKVGHFDWSTDTIW
jgi:hypothetical protein